MRPTGDTAVASIVNMPAPDCSSWPQCTMCQSVAQPSTAEYWHIGDTTMRLVSLSLRSVKGENRAMDMATQGRPGNRRVSWRETDFIGCLDCGVTVCKRGRTGIARSVLRCVSYGADRTGILRFVSGISILFLDTCGQPEWSYGRCAGPVTTLCCCAPHCSH